MNDPRKLRKSSDEVRVKLVDSDKPEQKYWDVEESHTYRDKGNLDRFEADSKSRTFHTVPKTDHRSYRSNSKNQISIQFDLNETRQMTQDQKQTILNTLIAENPESSQTVTKTQYRNLILENGLIPLIALLAFFTFFSIILIAALTSGHHYYY